MLWALAVRCGVCFKRATCRENNYAGRTIMPGEHARPGSCRPPNDADAYRALPSLRRRCLKTGT